MTVAPLPIHQLPRGSLVDDGRPLATLGITPERISERATVEWFDGHDDLDDYRAAVFRVAPHDVTLALIAYRNDPHGGTLVLGPPSTASRDIDTLLGALRVEDAEVVDRVDARSPSSASMELSLEAEELQRQVESLEATLELVASATRRLRDEAAESLSMSLEESKDRLWLVAAVRHARLDELSSRQREVLSEALKGLSNEEIAAALGIRADTVRAHLRAVRNRLAHAH